MTDRCQHVQSPAAALLTLDMAVKLDGMPQHKRLSTLGCTIMTAVVAFVKVTICNPSISNRWSVRIVYDVPINLLKCAPVHIQRLANT